jgi:Leucine-rich repeat (LRR) protein
MAEQQSFNVLSIRPTDRDIMAIGDGILLVPLLSLRTLFKMRTVSHEWNRIITQFITKNFFPTINFPILSSSMPLSKIPYLDGIPHLIFPQNIYNRPLLESLRTVHLPSVTIEEGRIEDHSFPKLNVTKLLMPTHRENNVNSSQMFKQVSGVQVLDISKTGVSPFFGHYVFNDRLYPKDFPHLNGVEELTMQYRDIPAGAFAELHGLKKLDMTGCNCRLSDNDFRNFGSLTHLFMRNFNSPNFTGEAFSFLTENLTELDISEYPRLLSDDVFTNLSGLKILKMASCGQPTITSTAFAKLAKLTLLDMSYCKQLTNTVLANKPNLKTLNVSYTKLTNEAFTDLPQLEELSMRGCKQITGAVFEHLPRLTTLDISFCPDLTPAIILLLPHLHTVTAVGCNPELIDTFSLSGVTVILH